VGLARAAAPAAPGVNDTCLACHGDKEAKGADGKSIAVEATTFAQSVHGEMHLKCTDCHGDVSAQKLPHPEKPRPVDCANCHQKEVKEYSGTVANPRLYAHTMADEVHLQQRALRGVARTKLTFVSDRNRERLLGPVDNREVKEIYVSDYDGANQRRITTTRQLNLSPSWSPDARAVAYSSFRNITPQIFISLIYQGVLENATKGIGSNYMPVFSPDGTKIAFMSNRDGNPEIYVMNRDGSDVRRLTNLTGLGLGGAHFANWSPNGRKVVFNSFWGGQPKRDIYVIDIDGSGLTKLTEDPNPLAPIDDIRPDWSPDGRRIAFQSNRTGNHEIFVMNPDGTDVQQLTSHAATDAAPEWSPDGKRIAFQSNRDGNDDIWLMNADGSGLVQLTDNSVRDAKPSWSPDGKRIAFHRDVEYLGEVHAELFSMNVDGSDVQMLSVPSFKGFHGFPSWSQGHDAVP